MEPKYSFILPAYKAGHLKEAIESILNQSYKDFEIVVVNDASPENIDSVIEQITDPRIRYYRNTVNIGGKDLVAQWNKCLTYSKGKFVILATDDDLYHPSYLKTMDELVNKYPEVDAFRPRISYFGTITHTDIEGYLPEYTPKDEFLYFYLKRSISTGIGFWIFRKSRLDKCGGYQSLPAAWFADDMTVMVMCEHGVVMSNDVLFKFRVHDQSISGKKNDSALLGMKLKAHIQFESFCKQYFAIGHRKVSTCQQHIGNSDLLKLAIDLNRRIWLWDMQQSTRKAVIKNFTQILQSDGLSRIVIIKIILKKLLHI